MPSLILELWRASGDGEPVGTFVHSPFTGGRPSPWGGASGCSAGWTDEFLLLIFSDFNVLLIDIRAFKGAESNRIHFK